jgi:hypothetical protein
MNPRILLTLVPISCPLPKGERWPVSGVTSLDSRLRGNDRRGYRPVLVAFLSCAGQVGDLTLTRTMCSHGEACAAAVQQNAAEGLGVPPDSLFLPQRVGAKGLKTVQPRHRESDG